MEANKFRKSGFTLLELVLYVAISAITLVTVVTFAWAVINSDTRIDVSAEVIQNTRFCMDKFTTAIQEATNIDIPNSTFDINPGVLALDYGTGDDILFNTYQKTVISGGNEIAITKLRMKTGSADYVDLTSDDLTVTNFIVSNLSRGEAENVGLQFTFEYVNPADDNLREESIDIETSASIRKK